VSDGAFVVEADILATCLCQVRKRIKVKVRRTWTKIVDVVVCALSLMALTGQIVSESRGESSVRVSDEKTGFTSVDLQTFRVEAENWQRWLADLPALMTLYRILRVFWL